MSSAEISLEKQEAWVSREESGRGKMKTMERIPFLKRKVFVTKGIK